MDNKEAVKILCRAREEDVDLRLELDTGSKIQGKVCKITPYDKWEDVDLVTTDFPTCVVELNEGYRSAMVDQYRETGITRFISVDHIACIVYNW